MKILDESQIRQKIQRLAIEILENNIDADELILVGINNNGMGFARLLLEALLPRSESPITLTRVRLNPADPLSEDILLEIPAAELKSKNIILIDDVANTGRTLFYAARPIMDTLPNKVEVAVLVDRTHKAFPIRVDYVGLSLATTLKENISVKILEVEEQAVFLD